MSGAKGAPARRRAGRPNGDPVEEIALLPTAYRDRILTTLPMAARREMVVRWRKWAHDGQYEPAGDWRVWLIRAGRGFGKTRAGAEWVPVGWARPAFDVLQLEDYDWCALGNPAATARGVAAAEARLGYAVDEQQYFAGFVLNSEDRGQWAAIDAAAVAAQARGVARVFIWALPQVMRDGFVHFDAEDAVTGFDDVSFPIELGRQAEVAPEHSTAIVTSAGGHEARNAAWGQARTRYDVGPGSPMPTPSRRSIRQHNAIVVTASSSQLMPQPSS